MGRNLDSTMRRAGVPGADSTGLGVLPAPAKWGNCCILDAGKREISSYFPGVIAVLQNKLLLHGSCRLSGAAMSTTYAPGSLPRRADNVELAPRISEDWLSLIIGLAIFIVALAGIANVDLLGWVVTTSVWADLGKALGPVSKSYGALGGRGAAQRREEVRARLHRGVLDRLRELGDRQFRAFRRGDAGRATEIRHRLVAQADQRGRLHLRAH